MVVDSDHPFVDRLHHRFLLAHQQADFTRLQRENLLLNAAGKKPREHEQGNEQQNGSEQNIDGFTDGNGVEVAGEVAHGDNPHHLTVIAEDRCFAA